MLQWLWAEGDYRVDVGRVTKGGHMQHSEVWEKQIQAVFLSICRPRVTTLSAIQQYRFYTICLGSMNNPVYNDFVYTLPSKGRCQSDKKIGESQIATHHVTKHNTPIHNILSTAPQLSISQKALGTLSEDGNVMPKHVAAIIHNKLNK
jgi:hypothetical protein